MKAKERREHARFVAMQHKKVVHCHSSYDKNEMSKIRKENR